MCEGAGRPVSLVSRRRPEAPCPFSPPHLRLSSSLLQPSPWIKSNTSASPSPSIFPALAVGLEEGHASEGEGLEGADPMGNRGAAGVVGRHRRVLPQVQVREVTTRAWGHMTAQWSRQSHKESTQGRSHDTDRHSIGQTGRRTSGWLSFMPWRQGGCHNVREWVT